MRPKVRKIPTLSVNSVVLLCVLVSATTVANTIDCGAQEKEQKLMPPVESSTEPNSKSVLVEPNEDYRICPGDVIDIQIDHAPELSGTFRVTAAGTFVIPYLGRVTAQRKTSEELSNIIAVGLRGRYLKDPKVTVTVTQINSHSFFIQGAVRRPGVYQIEGRPSLLKLITVAGGLGDNHGSSAFVIREIKLERPEMIKQRTNPLSSAALDLPHDSSDEEDAKYEMVKMNISGLLRGRFDQNILLEAGDIINIPPTDVFFVTGEVREPGSYPLKDGTTLRQAISLSQGTTFKAAADRGIIFREDLASGRRQEIKVDISAVMSGRKEDIPIMSNDIIIVPNSRFKSVGSALLTAFGMSSPRILYR